MSLKGKICLVTGASRGIGKGIAVQLGSAGATVYITGRSLSSLNECANEIKNRGGQAIPIQVDHSKDAEVEELFDKIKKDQKGQLDVLVNNAYAAVSYLTENDHKPFWELPGPGTWDIVNDVGLRNHYICTVHGARLMVPRKSGLIINVSSPGGLKYLFNVAYGVGKAGMDRMAADCAHELKDKNITMISLWPGPVKTEEISQRVLDKEAPSKKIFENGESTEFAGMAVKHLAMDNDVMKYTGKILLTYNLAVTYDFYDIDGQRNGDILNVKRLLELSGRTWLASLVPSFLRMPLFMVHYGSYKF